MLPVEWIKLFNTGSPVLFIKRLRMFSPEKETQEFSNQVKVANLFHFLLSICTFASGKNTSKLSSKFCVGLMYPSAGGHVHIKDSPFILMKECSSTGVAFD